MYDTNLVEYLKNNPQREVVYMNAEGGWLLHPRLSYPVEVSRDTILGTGKATKEPIAETPSTKKQNPKK